MKPFNKILNLGTEKGTKHSLLARAEEYNMKNMKTVYYASGASKDLKRCNIREMRQIELEDSIVRMSSKILVKDTCVGERCLVQCEGEKFTNFIREKIKDMAREFDSVIFTHNGIENHENTVGILYSGGYDSTLLAIKALSSGKDIVPIINNFNAGFVGSDLLTLFALNNLSELKRIFPGRKVYEPVVGDVALGGSDGMCRLQQQIRNIVSAPLSVYNFNLKEIWIGFITEDTENSYIPDLKRVYNAVWSVNDKSVLEYSVSKPVLKFPILKYWKNDVLRQISDFVSKCKIKPNLTMLSCERIFTNASLYVIYDRKTNNPTGYFAISFNSADCSCNKCRKTDHNYFSSIAGFGDFCYIFKAPSRFWK